MTAVNYAAMHYAVEESPSTGAAWQVLVVIAYRADRQTGECFTSRRRLAAEARISTSTVHDALNALIARGELEVLAAGAGRRSAAYRVVIPDPSNDSFTEPLQTIPSDSPTEPLARSDSPTEPQVVTRSPSHKRRSDSVATTVVARSPDSPNRKRRENLEGKIKIVPASPAAESEPIDAEIIDDPPVQPETAQTVLAAYIDWRRDNGIDGFDRRTLGQLAKHLGIAFEANHPPDVIKRGLWDWHHSGQHPSTLLSFIDAVARNAGRNGHRLTDAERRQRASLQELLT